MKKKSKAFGLFTGLMSKVLLLSLGYKISKNEVYLKSIERHLKDIKNNIEERDFFSGSAGVIWGCCTIYKMLGYDFALDVAKELAAEIIEGFCFSDCYAGWTVNGGRKTEEKNIHYGLAHGNTGIAFSLYILGRDTGNKHLVNFAISVLVDVFENGRNKEESHMVFQRGDDELAPNSNWCSGVGGYVWVLAQLDEIPHGLRGAYEWSKKMFLDSIGYHSSTLCHGMAGQLETLRLIENQSQDDLSQEKATLSLLLKENLVKDGEFVTWFSESPNLISPDLWVGFLGPSCSLTLFSRDYKYPLLSPENLCSLADYFSVKDIKDR